MYPFLRFLLLLSLAALACSSPFSLAAAPTPTVTLIPSPTELPPTPTPSPTPTPIPLPTPTPLPGARIAAGDQALFNGDWQAALEAYQQALNAAPDMQQRGAALTGLGRVYWLRGDSNNALQMLRQAIDEGASGYHRAEAYFFLAKVYEAINRPLDAADAALRYLLERPGVLDAIIYEWRGDLLTSAGDLPGALLEYQAAQQSPRLAADFSLEIKLARAYARSGDYQTALVMYDDLYARTNQDYLKAQLAYLKGLSYTNLGLSEAAQTAYLDAVNNYPANADAHASLVALVNAGYPVDELQRGIVNYFASQYSLSLAALDRYLANAPADPARAYYYRGLALWQMDNDAEAIAMWDAVIQNYPTSNMLDRAYEMKGYAQWADLGNYAGGVQTLIEFAEHNPGHPRADEFMYDAGLAAERGELLLEASAAWQRLANQWPASRYAYQSLLKAGLADYRRGEFSTAAQLFQRALITATQIEDKAAALFWLGKNAQAAGDEESAGAFWQQSAAADPTGFYSERARDLLLNRPPFDPPAAFDAGYDPAAERRQAEDWLRTTFALPPETDFSGPGQLTTDTRWQRGMELWRLGEYNQAVGEFEALRSAIQTNPVAVYLFANEMVAIGAYRPAILAARQVLTLAGLDDAASLTAPMHFNRIRFGLYFNDLVVPTAQSYSFHPLLVWSLMRQESFFDRAVRSSVGARGLMQIMPPTGQDIAGRLRWPADYTSADLDRPLVSIRFGLSYLDAQRAYFGGDMYAALAAYNGGPGNAAIWKRLAPNDPDLFFEIIRFDETRRYIRGIYEMHNIYRRLYSRAP